MKIQISKFKSLSQRLISLRLKNYISKFKIIDNIISNLQPTTYSFKLNTGFTLVEVLVVIAIVTMVMAVIFPNFMAARQRARDAQRKNDLSQMQKGLELFKMDMNPQAYPTSNLLATCGGCWTTAGLTVTCTPNNIYMRKLPCDPGSTNPTPYLYALDGSDPLKYTISACLENLADPDKDLIPEPTCTARGGASYTVYEP